MPVSSYKSINAAGLLELKAMTLDALLLGIIYAMVFLLSMGSVLWQWEKFLTDSAINVSFLIPLVVGSGFLIGFCDGFIMWFSPIILLTVARLAQSSQQAATLPMWNAQTADYYYWIVLSTTLLICPLINWLYHALSESSRKRGSLGQQLVGIQVVDQNGNTISFAKASERHLLKGLTLGFNLNKISKCLEIKP